MLAPASSNAEFPRFFPADIHEPAERRRILMVDDHALARLTISNLCASVCKDVEVLEATSLSAALALHEKYEDSVELVLLDLNLPDSKGFAGLLTLKRRFPATRVIVLAGTFDEAVAAEACGLGAEKLLHRGADPALLASTLSDLAQPLFPKHLRQPAWTARGRRAAPPAAHSLSRREIEILDLVLQGKTNEEIAADTRLKLGTVKNHISGLFVVFGVASRCRLVTLFA